MLRIMKIGSTIAMLLPMVLASEVNAANCNIFFDWKSCFCAVTNDTGDILKRYTVNIGGWASCDVEGCTSSNAGMSGTGHNNVTMSSICIPQ